MSRRRPPPTRCPPARFLTPLLLLLFRLQGDAGDNFYLIRSGEVKCTKVGSADEVSRRLKKGDFFGELALLSTDKRAATVSSVEKTTVLTLGRVQFTRLLGPLKDIMAAADQGRK